MGMDLVEQFALLEGFSEDQIDLLRPLIEDVRFETEQVIFEQGDKADYLFFVMDGKVSIQFNP